MACNSRYRICTRCTKQTFAIANQAHIIPIHTHTLANSPRAILVKPYALRLYSLFNTHTHTHIHSFSPFLFSLTYHHVYIEASTILPTFIFSILFPCWCCCWCCSPWYILCVFYIAGAVCEGVVIYIYQCINIHVLVFKVAKTTVEYSIYCTCDGGFHVTVRA